MKPMKPILGAAVLALLAANPVLAQPATSAAARPAASTCPPLLQHTVPRLQDEKPQALCQYAGKVLLVVNTASYCGFTPQFEGLESLHAKYNAQGLVVLGFPSNDFRQEDPDAKKIADVCFNTYGVRFPMFTTVAVRGSGAHPLFAMLTRASGQAPSWNFNKYLVGRDGKVVAHYGSSVGPTSGNLMAAVEKALAAKP
jgi:glutathione peroxidase